VYYLLEKAANENKNIEHGGSAIIIKIFAVCPGDEPYKRIGTYLLVIGIITLLRAGQ
jgi:hypothetical protein